MSEQKYCFFFLSHKISLCIYKTQEVSSSFQRLSGFFLQIIYILQFRYTRSQERGEGKWKPEFCSGHLLQLWSQHGWVEQLLRCDQRTGHEELGPGLHGANLAE